MISHSTITLFVCSHENQEVIETLDYLNSKLTLHLCKDCQKIPEFSELIANHQIEKEFENK